MLLPKEEGNIINIRLYIENGFRAYYDRYYHISDEGFCRWMRPDVPDEMKVMDIDGEWSVWKLIPSQVTEQDIQGLEKEFGLKFPQWYKVFISTYAHYFDHIPEQDLHNPLDNIRDMYNPSLCHLGYLPFCWDAEYGHIFCIDVNHLEDEESCAIYAIDHDILFNEGVDIQASLEYLYPNFNAYFDHTFLEIK